MEYAKSLKWLTSNKVATIICLCFMMLTITYLFRRVLPYNTYDFQDFWHKNSSTLSMWQPIPFAFLMIIIAQWQKSKLIFWLNRLCRKEVVYPICYTILALCAITTLAGNTTGFWWTWFSLGLLVATALLSYIFVQNKVTPVEAIIISCATSSLWRGIWEIPYQIGLKLYYDMPQPQVTAPILRHMIAYEIAIELMLILGGIIILLYYHWKYGILNFRSSLFKYGLLAYILLMASWYISGFWVDVYYDWTKLSWVYTEHWDKISMVIYKTSKVALALSIAGLLIKKEAK